MALCGCAARAEGEPFATVPRPRKRAPAGGIAASKRRRIHCMCCVRIMSDSENDWVDAEPNAPLQVPEWSCASIYACGRRFSAMTYAEMYQKVQDLHIASGGVHLDVHARPSDCKGGDMEVLPGSVQFYCPHSRDHGNQCGQKPPANPTATRVDRKHEEKRVYFNRENPCSFRFTVRRCKESSLPQQLCKPNHGHKNYMACEVKCGATGSSTAMLSKKKRVAR